MIIDLIKYKKGYLGVSLDIVKKYVDGICWNYKKNDISSFKNHTIKTDDEIYFKVICATSNLNIQNTPIIDLNFDDDINQIEIEDECLFHKNCGMKGCMEYILGAVTPKTCLNNNKKYVIVKNNTLVDNL